MDSLRREPETSSSSLRGFSPSPTAGRAKSRPLVEALKAWFEDRLKRISKTSPVRGAINYGLNQWDGLIRYLEFMFSMMLVQACQSAAPATTVAQPFWFRLRRVRLSLRG